ncbi:MAG: hypothetical protein M1825_005204 [Sarcosagium campestre]|nr:MAG: hypothetical protein M1825_005204 [Sarcosagium campestre]
MPRLLPCRSRPIACHFCINRQSLRLLSTSCPRFKVRPESPEYIEIPQPPQQRPSRPRQVKGTLPAPRNIFHRRGGDKTSADYLASATPEPEKSITNPSQVPHSDASQAERIAWKNRLAETRRRNLRESVVELSKRHEQTKKALAIRRVRRQAEREELLSRKEREDERLTAATVTAAMRQLQVGKLPDPGREARVAQGTANAIATEQRRSQSRQEALHTLYMNARNFITTEAQLAEEVERVFAPQPEEWTDVFVGRNIWNRGPPETVQDMLNVLNKAEKNALAYHSGYGDLSSRRVKRIAEELTGGKMDDDSQSLR